MGLGRGGQKSSARERTAWGELLKHNRGVTVTCRAQLGQRTAGSHPPIRGQPDSRARLRMLGSTGLSERLLHGPGNVSRFWRCHVPDSCLGDLALSHPDAGPSIEVLAGRNWRNQEQGTGTGRRRGPQGCVFGPWAHAILHVEIVASGGRGGSLGPLDGYRLSRPRPAI